MISWDATALQLPELVGDTEWQRGGDDVVVIDEHWRCLGIVRLTEVVRGVAEAKVEQAAALNPLTRLPGTDTVAREIDLSVSVSLATLVCGLDTVRSYRDASKLLAPLKKQAKAVPGSSWVLGRPDTDKVDVLRGRARAVS